MSSHSAVWLANFLLAVQWSGTVHAADPAPAPIPIAVLDLDHVDTSGEVIDQSSQHHVRLQTFTRTLREDLDRGGYYRVILLSCDPAPCSITESEPEELFAAAQRAGAKLLLFGGIHKMSTLVQFAKVQMVDVDRNQVVLRRSMSFRGDDDRSWQHAQMFLARELNEAAAKCGAFEEPACAAHEVPASADR